MSANNKHILIVTADDYTRESCRHALEQEGYYIIEATDAHQALAALGGTVVHAILADIDLGEISGLSFLTHIRMFHPTIQVILMADSSQSSCKARALQCGASGFLIKPFSETSLLVKSVDRALAQCEVVKK